MTQKQKQVQNVKIYVGEQKPKRRRRAPARRAPAPRAPRVGGGGGAGGGGGGPLPFPPPPPLGSTGTSFFPQMFPQRAGPAVEPRSQLQQLIKPLEQSLLRLEQQAQRPALPAPAEEKEEARKPFSIQDVRHLMAQYVESLPMYEEPARPAISSSSAMTETSDIGTQTRGVSTRETGTQVQLVQPQQPLIQAGQEPLVDRVVSPIIFTPMGGMEPEYDFPEIREGPSQPSTSSSSTTPQGPILPEEEEEDIVFPIIRDYKPEDIRALERDGKITREFLEGFQVKKITKPQQRNMNLVKIAVSLGIPTSRSDQSQTKKFMIDYILRKLGEKK